MSNDSYWDGQQPEQQPDAAPTPPDPSTPYSSAGEGSTTAQPGSQQYPAWQPTNTAEQPAASWPVPESPLATQEHPPTKPPKKSGGRGLASLIAVAVLAAGVGGGAGVLVDRSFTSTSSEPVATASSVPESTIPAATTTKVVQGDSANPDWSVTAAAVKKSVVSITAASGSSGDAGTGVVIDSAGHIVTNNHVVSSAGSGARITVQVDNASYQATIVGTDPSTDLAVLKVATLPSGLSPITLADSSKASVGDPVMAVGNPLGLSDTVTTGVVSALNRPVVTQQVSGSVSDGSGNGRVYTSAIQTSAPINPGNSGGPLVNADGQLIGINSSIASLSQSSSGSQTGSIGIGFAIPSNLVKYISEQLIADGTARHAYLGISTSDAQAQGQSSTVSGAQVATVVSGGPAASAGLRAGDLVTAFDGIPIGSSDALVAEIRSCRVGQRVTLTVLRGGATQKVQVTLSAAPR